MLLVLLVRRFSLNRHTNRRSYSEACRGRAPRSYLGVSTAVVEWYGALRHHITPLPPAQIQRSKTIVTSLNTISSPSFMLLETFGGEVVTRRKWVAALSTAFTRRFVKSTIGSRMGAKQNGFAQRAEWSALKGGHSKRVKGLCLSWHCMDRSPDPAEVFRLGAIREKVLCSYGALS